MAHNGAARADSGSGRSRLIYAVFNSLLTLGWGARCFGPSAFVVQPGKRNFADRDWRANSGAQRGRTAGIRFADSGWLANLLESHEFLSPRETPSVCQDWMVGDAGIEPATPPV
jgi:hypothetical protein